MLSGVTLQGRLLDRLRLADDVVLLADVAGARKLTVSDRGSDGVIDVSSDEPFIRSLDRAGHVSLDPGLGAPPEADH